MNLKALALILLVLLSGCLKAPVIECGDDKSCFAEALDSCQPAVYSYSQDYYGDLTGTFKALEVESCKCLFYKDTYFAGDFLGTKYSADNRNRWLVESCLNAETEFEGYPPKCAEDSIETETVYYLDVDLI